MNTAGQINLIAAWIGILLGFLSGMVLGLFFHRENWLGGYGSFKRRLYRLAHISFFGLAAANFFFHLTLAAVPFTRALDIASTGFLVGAVAMPVCCLLMAHFPKTRMLFAVPVISLTAGAVLTTLEVIKL